MTDSPPPLADAPKIEPVQKMHELGDGLPLSTCTLCRRRLPLSSFSLKKGSTTKVAVRCDGCRATPMLLWGSRNPDKMRAASRRHIASGGARAHRLKVQYDLSQAQYAELLSAQNGLCAICETSEPGGRWPHFHIDHDHGTGRIRGLLCTNCNRGLGYFKDRSDRLLVAVAYLGAGT